MDPFSVWGLGSRVTNMGWIDQFVATGLLLADLWVVTWFEGCRIVMKVRPKFRSGSMGTALEPPLVIPVGVGILGGTADARARRKESA